MKDIRWNKIMLREFRSLVCLTDDEERILVGWANGNSITKISTDSNMSERTVSSVIARLRAMYDDVQPYTPLLPQRDIP